MTFKLPMRSWLTKILPQTLPCKQKLRQGSCRFSWILFSRTRFNQTSLFENIQPIQHNDLQQAKAQPGNTKELIQEPQVNTGLCKPVTTKVAGRIHLLIISLTLGYSHIDASTVSWSRPLTYCSPPFSYAWQMPAKECYGSSRMQCSNSQLANTILLFQSRSWRCWLTYHQFFCSFSPVQFIFIGLNK